MSALAGLEGVVDIIYRPEGDLFVLTYLHEVISLDAVFAAVRALGIQRGLNYEPQIKGDEPE